MITAPDFEKKQIVFVFFNEGEKMSITNDNLRITDKDGTVKLQCTCYRLFLVFAVGNFSITSAVIQKAKKFGFFIACMSAGFHINNIIGAEKDGNTMLKARQYAYKGNGIGAQIIKNKIKNQRHVLMKVRNKNELIKEAIAHLDEYYGEIRYDMPTDEIMGYEGLAAKVYFKNHFNNVLWKGRQPRLKRDFVNSSLDIGYTVLFTFIDCIAQSYGFDTYVGVLHKQFYMRKSLICDLVEPFRPIIDMQVKKAINLGQIKEEDFMDVNGQKILRYEHSNRYVKLFMMPIIEERVRIFNYIKGFYNAFMKGLDGGEFPMFLSED